MFTTIELELELIQSHMAQKHLLYLVDLLRLVDGVPRGQLLVVGSRVEHLVHLASCVQFLVVSFVRWIAQIAKNIAQMALELSNSKISKTLETLKTLKNSQNSQKTQCLE